MNSAISLLPALATWLFASLFLQPRLEMIWQKAGLVGSHVQWLMSFVNAFNLGKEYFWFLIVGIALLLAFLESRVPAWARHRSSILFSATVFINASVSAWILALATAALVAGPVLAKPK